MKVADFKEGYYYSSPNIPAGNSLALIGDTLYHTTDKDKCKVTDTDIYKDDEYYLSTVDGIHMSMPDLLWLNGEVFTLKKNTVLDSNFNCLYGTYSNVKLGRANVSYVPNTDTFRTSLLKGGITPNHLSNRSLYRSKVDSIRAGKLSYSAPETKLKTKENKMDDIFTNTIVNTDTLAQVKEETVDVAQITIGKLIYTNGTAIASNLAPKLKWYEKLLTSSKKRELALLVGTYVAIKAVQTKYNHYLLQSVSAYINFQLQTKLLGGVTQDTLDKLFTKFEKVEK